MMLDSLLESLFAALAPVLFILFWYAILVLIARVGGWSLLARSYATKEIPPANLRRFQSGQFRAFTGYNGCLSVGTSPHGLYLAVLFFFRPGHPPLLLPWSDLLSRVHKRFLFVHYEEFHFRKAPGVPVRLPSRLVERLEGEKARRLIPSPAKGNDFDSPPPGPIPPPR